MAHLLNLFPLQLLFGVFWLRLLQIASSHQVSTRSGENVTLLCNITDYPEISWYQLRSEDVKMLISAKQGRVEKRFRLSNSVQEGHFEMVEINSSVHLLIIGVSESDLGFYYCVGRTNTELIQFGKPIELKFTDDLKTNKINNSPDVQQSELWITRSVCLLSVLINLICMSVFFCRLTGKSLSSYSCCCNNKDSSEKGENIHYASIQHKSPRKSKAKNHTADSDSVSYATVATQPRRR